MQIVEALLSQLSPRVVELISQRFGLDPQVTQRGLEKLLPMVLGAIGLRAATPSGAADLNLLTRGETFPADANGLADLMGNESAFSGLTGHARDWALGEKAELIGGEMAHQSGLPVAAGAGLAGALGALGLGHFQNLAGQGDVAATIAKHADELKALLPGPIAGMLATPAADVAERPRVDVAAAAIPKAQITSKAVGKAPFAPWILPIGLIAAFTALALGLVPGLMPGDKGVNVPKHEEKAHSEGDHGKEEAHGKDEAKPATEAEGGHSAVEGAVSEGLKAAELPDGTTLSFPAASVEDKLLGFILDDTKVVDKTTWFTFERLQFDTGKATLRPESNEQLDNVAKILAAYPNVKLKIGGYTDNTGDATMNMALSASRAAATVEALVGRGVAADRLESEGYGDQHPVAPNDTEEGRQQNRRIDMRVTAK